MYRHTIAGFQSQIATSKECRVQHDETRSAYSSKEGCHVRKSRLSQSFMPGIMLLSGLGKFLEATLLLINAIAVLSEDRFLARRMCCPIFTSRLMVTFSAVGWVSGQPQNVQQYDQVGYGPGGVQGDPSVKARLIDLISAVRTLLRSASFCPSARCFTQLLCHVSTSNRHKHNRHYIRGAPRLSRLTVSWTTCITPSYRHSTSPKCRLRPCTPIFHTKRARWNEFLLSRSYSLFICLTKSFTVCPFCNDGE